MLQHSHALRAHTARRLKPNRRESRVVRDDRRTTDRRTTDSSAPDGEEGKSAPPFHRINTNNTNITAIALSIEACHYDMLKTPCPSSMAVSSCRRSSSRLSYRGRSSCRKHVWAIGRLATVPEPRLIGCTSRGGSRSALQHPSKSIAVRSGPDDGG